MRIANKTLIKQWCRYNLDLVVKSDFYFVFCKEQKGDQPFGLGTWNRCWREIKDRVIEAGGDWMNKKNISYYSFRHSGISFAVQRGVNHLKLARNAGTGLRYIEAFYYHHEAELSTTDLSKGRTFFATVSYTHLTLPTKA